MADLTRAKQQTLAFLQQSALDLARIVNNFDAANGKMLGTGLAKLPAGTLDATKWVDSTPGDPTTTPPTPASPGDFGPGTSVYAHLGTADVAALYAIITQLRAAITPQVLAAIQKWAP